jgi:LPS-assembly protein
MKNRIYTLSLLILLFSLTHLKAEELKIKSLKINMNNNTKVVVFEGDVVAEDYYKNKLFTDFAKYDKKNDLLKSEGATKIVTSEGFIIYGKDISFDNKKRIISSNKQTEIVDKDGNKINAEMFNYLVDKKIILSKGNTRLIDINNNKYNFSEIYIDEKSKKIIGSDVKMHLDQKSVSGTKDNEPRFYANTFNKSGETSTFDKGVFTYCKFKENEKCPPWVLQSKKIKHNSSNKTIYYENAVLKIYDFPIFFFPRLSHPDPSVKRRSGFLFPSMSSSSNTGSGISLPYFLALSKDKDVTFTPKLYGREHPLLMAEYRQDFEKSFLIVDTSYTKGYKQITNTKTPGGRAHFFSKFNLSFLKDENKTSNLEVNLQNVSNNTYFKIHDIDTSLVNKEIDVLENTVNYDYYNEDIFFGATFSAFENLTINSRKKYEYLLPYLTFDKNLFVDEQYGALDLSSNLRIRNYDVNKQTEFFINDLNWKSKKWINNFGLESEFKSLLKTVNYQADNTEKFKNEKEVSELSGAFGYLAKLPLYKNNFENKHSHLLTPKILVRYAPGHMRRASDGRLNYSNLFEINKANEIDIVENGLSTSIGINYKKNNLDNDNNIINEKVSASIGQVISEKENRDMASTTSLDQRFSDIVGATNLRLNDNFDFKYNFAIDQGYRRFNSNEVGSSMTFGNTNFNVSYLEEKNHIGNQEYVQTDLGYTIGNSGELSFSTKRNILKSSAEFYNLSYTYLNDCLKAGIVFRREFYTDRDIEPDNSVMFKISLTPFTDINSPLFNK